MKSLLKVTVLMCGTFLIACAQNQNVPPKANKAFEEKFANATKISWDQESKDEWEAEFKMNGKQYSANFKKNGDWVETESEIESSEVPALVSNSMQENYPNVQIKGVYKVERENGTSYEFEFMDNGKTKEVVISESGKIQNSSREELEEEDDDN